MTRVTRRSDEDDISSGDDGSSREKAKTIFGDGVGGLITGRCNFAKIRFPGRGWSADASYFRIGEGPTRTRLPSVHSLPISSTISGKQELGMRTFLWITGVIVAAIPIVIAERRKCNNLPWIYFLTFFLSWTIIGWVAAMAWAIWGDSDPERFAKAVR